VDSPTTDPPSEILLVPSKVVTVAGS
jgi:hypothetical protein